MLGTCTWKIWAGTVKGDNLYAVVLNPSEGPIELPALGLKSENQPQQIQTIKLIGSDDEVKFSQSDDKLVLTVPANRPSLYAAAFKIEGVLLNEQ
jgi:alpha-L-fucosidase